ncbi:MAG: transcriptional regulator [Methanosaeta sp. SDB]|nr:MAG: transcriptional regulator [Methanosaeta sp. SDB]
MKLPCEYAVWDTLPNIRAAIAKELVDRGISQKEVSQLLNISPPAVSQYVSKKRGYSIVFSDEIKEAIEKLADEIVENKEGDPTEKICEICRMLREGEDADDLEDCEVC